MKNISLSEAKSMSPAGGLREKDNALRIEHLNKVLANEFALFTKTLNYHWNVEGPRFHSMHEFLEKQYRELLEITDDTAERVRILDGRPISTLKEISKEKTTIERPGQFPKTVDMLNDLLRDHLTICDTIKTAMYDCDFDKDPSTEDFFVELLRKHEEMSWQLKSHLES